MAGTPATVGNFTEGTPRLVQKGGLEMTGDGSGYEDIWTLVLPTGTGPDRPAASYVGFPAIGDAGITGYVCTRIRWTQRGADSKIWDAAVEYKTGEVTPSSQGAPGWTDYNKRWGTRVITSDLTQDAISGAAVVNAAGEPFEQVPQREIVCPSVSFQRVISTAPATIMAYNGTVNNAAVTIMGITFGIHCARISIDARKLDDGGVGKYEYTIRVDGAKNMYSAAVGGTVSDIGWDVSILNAGYTRIDTSDSNTLKAILIPDGQGRMVRPTEPQLLSLAGEWPNVGAGYFLKFSPYPEADWSALNLPTT